MQNDHPELPQHAQRHLESSKPTPRELEVTLSAGISLPAAVLFDMDGTLIDGEPMWEIAMYDLARRLGGTLTPAIRDQVIGNHVRTTMPWLLREIGCPDADAGESADWLESRVGELYGAGAPWKPGARELVTAVRAAGIPTGLVTSTNRDLVEIVFARLLADADAFAAQSGGVADVSRDLPASRRLFDVVVTGDQVTLVKPDPESYLTAAKLLGVSPGDCVALEDSPAGIASAVAAGCVVVAVPDHLPVPPNAHVAAIRDSLIGLTPTDLVELMNQS